MQVLLIEQLHKINIKAGYKCSEHKHEHKWNGFYVISGVLEIHVAKNNYDLTDVTTLRAGRRSVGPRLERLHPHPLNGSVAT